MLRRAQSKACPFDRAGGAAVDDTRFRGGPRTSCSGRLMSCTEPRADPRPSRFAKHSGPSEATCAPFRSVTHPSSRQELRVATALDLTALARARKLAEPWLESRWCTEHRHRAEPDGPPGSRFDRRPGPAVHPSRCVRPTSAIHISKTSTRTRPSYGRIAAVGATSHAAPPASPDCQPPRRRFFDDHGGRTIEL